MKIEIKRLPSEFGATIGQVFVNGERFCFSLEDEVREVINLPVQQWKIPGKTAIPKGTYKITLENSKRFGPNTLTVNNVPGFEFIRMHPGNTSANTEGCILLGLAVNGHEIVGGTSRPAVDMMKKRVEECVRFNEDVWLTIS